MEKTFGGSTQLVIGAVCGFMQGMTITTSPARLPFDQIRRVLLCYGPLAALLGWAAGWLLWRHGTPDVEYFWLPWLDQLRQHGLWAGYRASHSDYPPLMFVILSGVVWSSTARSIALFTALKLALLGGWIVALFKHARLRG